MAVVACGQKEAETMAAGERAAPAAAEKPAHVLLFVMPDKTAPAGLAQMLAGWKSAGALSDVVLVKKYGHEEKPGYDEGFNELAILDFPSESAYEQWRNSEAARLGPDVVASRADVLLDRRTKKNDPSKSIFVISQYESLVSPQEYQDYTDAYIEPNMANQMFSGIMTRYTMYLEREATGGLAHPKAVLVTEYANQAEFDRKKAVKDAYKAVLLSGTHPEWAHINDTKKALRTDKSETYAHPVEL
ncbi:hypothetical protein B1992_12635 [Pseudoxanthomonas broegbernensis]|uniref:Uncharacterized protein n=2 Tax=Pseudoxanthomonas broegbernensis TaxID=83619 RepID=A0A7V8GL17_9GAMM|nr:hypothetical protein B1992_12635 [Pseudoxanthomonas broegbernensis]